MTREYSFISLFEQFIQDTTKGKRLKPDGQKIKPQSIKNYRCVLGHLRKFEEKRNTQIRIRPLLKVNKKLLSVERNYWKRFYALFSEYLYKNHCFDNYVGNVFKIIRTFFVYLNRDRLILTGDFYKKFYIRREEIPILTLSPDQLQHLITNKSFEDSLPKFLKRIKDVFVFGCTVAVRYSDLFNIKLRDIELIGGNYYLSIKTIKTNTQVKIKLPEYAIDIVKKYSRRKSQGSKLFLSISLNQFNTDVKKLLELAGWTISLGKTRAQKGNAKEFLRDDSGTYRFCDLASSHLMRRTAVTTMLILGMPEAAVKKISGHSPTSSSFYRYVNYVQAYLDTEIDKVHSRLVGTEITAA